VQKFVPAGGTAGNIATGRTLYTSSTSEPSYYSTDSFFYASIKFLGVKFKIGTNTHYGWVNVHAGDLATNAVITDYAYEDIPCEGIGAGHIIPEAGSLALLARGATGLISW